MKNKLQEPREKSMGRNGQPAWEVALLFPNQGHWSEDEYLALETNHLVELSEGCLEVLPMPTSSHQWIVLYLVRLLDSFVALGKLGIILFAPLRVRLWPGKFREPDVVFLLEEHRPRAGEKFWLGADLVMEVVSDDPDDRRRDLIDKRAEYARAGIQEYWIVDPKLKQITVLWLKGKRYLVHGIFKKGQIAESRLLPGFSAQVDAVFDLRKK